MLSVGQPVDETSVRIWSESGVDLPTGEIGEIVVSGPQVISGYWQRPEESAHAIIDGYLRTGDVGYIDADGWVFLVDRQKDLIVASGYKIWPGDVERVLYGHPDVVETAVVGVPDEYRGETVRAYVVRRHGATLSATELIDYCREQMAAYRYPRQVVFLPELPKNPAGKILRRSLRETAHTDLEGNN